MSRRLTRPLCLDAPTLGMAALVTVLFGALTVALFWTQRHPGRVGGLACVELYAHAATAADTARIDERLLSGGRRVERYTCGGLRRAGELTPPLRSPAT